jgi:hyperosmotically inducible periplasmic protein
MLKRFTFIAAVSVMFAAAGCSKTDAGITTAVKARFAADDTVKAYQINVDTKNGVVTLKGAVETRAAKEQAVRLARETEGVTDVADSLTVNAPATLGERAHDAVREGGGDAVNATADAGVTAIVKTRLLADTMVRGLKIDVDTRGGVVTLSGTVRTATERERAVALARGTEGVKDVVDKLVIG